MVFNNAVSQVAQRKISEVLSIGSSTANVVHLHLIGGGCGGMELSMSVGDLNSGAIEHESIAGFVTDPITAQYIQGVVIDYEEGLFGSGFRFEGLSNHTLCNCSNTQ